MKKFLCLLFYCAFCVSAAAVSRFETGYTFTNVSMNDGFLPGANVVAFCNDGSQIWFGTRSGVVAISEFGRKSWNYQVLSHDAICLDSSGAVWLTTESGVYYYDALSQDLKLVNEDKYYCCSIPQEVCVFCNHQLLFYSAGTAQLLRVVELDSSSDIVSMAPLSDGSLVMGDSRGLLLRYSPSGGGLSKFSSYSISDIRRIRCIDDFVYALSYGGGIYKYSQSGEYLGRVEGIAYDYVTDLAKYDGLFWICTDGDGIYTLNPQTQEITHLYHIQGDNGSFPTNALTTLYSDGEYGLWAGSVRYGAYNISKRYIHTYSDALLNSTRGLSERCVVSLVTDASGYCWIGTDGQGINRYDPSTQTFRQYPSTYGLSVPGVCCYDDRHLLLTVYNKGLFLFDTQYSSLSQFKAISESEIMSGNGEYAGIISPRPDRVYIFAAHSFVHNPKTGSVEELKNTREWYLQGIPPVVWYNENFILLTRNNEIQINNYDDCMMRDLCSIPNGSITAISYDPVHSCIWTVADRNRIGYFNFDPNTQKTSEYTFLGELNLSNVSTLTTDTKGRIWVTTGGALYMYDRDTKSLKRFTNYDGYERNDILAAIHSPLDSNVFYVAGSSGLVKVNTQIAEMPGLSEPPVITLSEIITADRSIPSATIDQHKLIRIPWNKGLLKFCFSVTGLHFQEDPDIRYTILGETESALTTSNRVLDISSLSPGVYSLTAECLWNGDCQTNGETLKIKILPPWYKSTLFNIMVLIVVLFLLFFFTLRYAKTHIASSDHITSYDRDFLRRFCEYVALNLDQDLSYEALTKELGISRTSLYEKVKALTGYSLNDYVKKMRVDKAMSLLKDTDMNINEISDSVGFSFPRYFSSVFKEMTGESPTKFRKKHQKA